MAKRIVKCIQIKHNTPLPISLLTKKRTHFESIKSNKTLLLLPPTTTHFTETQTQYEKKQKPSYHLQQRSKLSNRIQNLNQTH